MSKLFLTSSFNSVAPIILPMLHDEQKGKKIMFVSTAAEGEEGQKSWLEDDREALRNMGFELIEYTITGKTEKDFAKDFEGIAYIFFSGGNTFHLLEKAQISNFIPFITDFLRKNDIVYIGSSAGAAIAGDNIYPLLNIDDPDKAPNLKGYKGFSLVDVVIMPHWGNDSFKERYLNQSWEHVYSDTYKIILLTDDEFLYTEDGTSFKLLKSK